MAERYGSGNLLCFVYRLQHERLPHSRLWDSDLDTKQQHPDSSLTASNPLKTPAKTSKAWHYALHACGGFGAPTPISCGRTTVVQLRLCSIFGRMAATLL